MGCLQWSGPLACRDLVAACLDSRRVLLTTIVSHRIEECRLLSRAMDVIVLAALAFQRH
jgi:hypothetical protein